MTTRIQVDNVKLVPTGLLASEQTVNEAIEYAVQQGVGWGLTRADSILLRVAYELAKMRTEIDELDELRESLDKAHREIKGLQLANGRLKKKAESTDD